MSLFNMYDLCSGWVIGVDDQEQQDSIEQLAREHQEENDAYDRYVPEEVTYTEMDNEDFANEAWED